MGSFKRALLGYRRAEVDAAMGARKARISALEEQVEEALRRWREARDAGAAAERELSEMSEMVIEREREIRHLEERLREANERHERSIGSLESLASRLEEVQSQARGQATRIRMKALREAVEVGRRAQEVAAAGAEGLPAQPSNGDGVAGPGLYEGLVKLEIGPLGDFSQLIGIEEAISRLGAAEISVERFSEGRATLSMRLEEPVELLRELEERAPMEFHIRRTAGDNLILDVDEDQGSEQQAA